MPQGGQIVFRTRPAAAGVALELIDTGVGMDDKALARWGIATNNAAKSTADQPGASAQPNDYE